jgi:hypothetical protein
LARRRDSLYWAKIRSLPLQTDEITSYSKKDSLSLKISQKRESKGTKGNSWFGKIVFGDHVNIGKKYRMEYGGLLGAIPEYNFVDGLWLGQNLTFVADFTKTQSLSISPSVYYVTARKTVVWNVEGIYKYAPLKNGILSLSGGNTSSGFARNGTSRMLNSLFALTYANSPVKFYQKKYIKASNRIDIANGLFLTTNIEYERRNALENRASYSFFGNEPSPNLPIGQLAPMPYNTLTKLSANVEYTPRYRYRIKDGRKSYAYSKYPTFGLNYEKAIPTDGSVSASFDRLDFLIKQEIKLNAFDQLEYLLNTGLFLSSENIFFPDYKHFLNNELYLTTHLFTNSFCIPEYSYSTSNRWIQAHLSYTSAYLLVKNLPFLQKYLFNESLHARTLWIPGKNYTEFGYSIGFFKLLRGGVFAGFENGRYNTTGFNISMTIDF